jgi:hypothetical protein
LSGWKKCVVSRGETPCTETYALIAVVSASSPAGYGGVPPPALEHAPGRCLNPQPETAALRNLQGNFSVVGTWPCPISRWPVSYQRFHLQTRGKCVNVIALASKLMHRDGCADRCSVGVLAGGLRWRPAASFSARTGVPEPAAGDGCATRFAGGTSPFVETWPSNPRYLAHHEEAGGRLGIDVHHPLHRQ